MPNSVPQTAGAKLFFLAATVFFSLLAAPLITALAANGYPFWAPGAREGLGVVLVVSLAATCLASRWRLVAVMAVAAAILSFLGANHFQRLGVGAVTSLFIGMVFLVVGIFLWRFSRQGWLVLTAMAGAILLASIGQALWVPYSPWRMTIDAELGQSGKKNPNDKPSILHIIFDEHAGIKSLPRDIPEAVQAETQIRAFYQKYGFLTFVNHFSGYFNTSVSLSSAVNFALDANPSRWHDSPKGGGIQHRTQHNALFKTLFDQGYAIHVYQSEYLDFCGGQENVIRSCLNYGYGNLYSLIRAPMANVDKMFVLFGHYFKAQRNDVFELLLNGLDRMRHRYPSVVKKLLTLGGWQAAHNVLPILDVPLNRIHTLSSFAVMEPLFADLQRHPTGHVFFAHLLIPHNPDVFDAQCHIKPAGLWLYRNDWEFEYGSDLALKKLHNAAYATQLQCLYRELDKRLAILRALGLADRLRFVFHGDHGSRIVRTLPDNSVYSAQQPEVLLEGFSALMAIAGPQVVPGENQYGWMLPNLLQEIYTEGALLTPESSAKRPITIFTNPKARGGLQEQRIDFIP